MNNLNIIYIPKFLDKITSENLLEKLKKEVFDLYENKEDNKSPRLIKWFGDFDYHYSNIEHKKEEIPDYVVSILNKINNFLLFEKLENKLNSVLINYYRNGKDNIGWHSDDLTQIGKDPVIASLSLGETRTMKFRHKETKEVISYTLNSGDLFIMHGKTQDYWQHSIPSEANKLERINLTFRKTKKNPI